MTWDPKRGGIVFDFSMYDKALSQHLWDGDVLDGLSTMVQYLAELSEAYDGYDKYLQEALVLDLNREKGSTYAPEISAPPSTQTT